MLELGHELGHEDDVDFDDDVKHKPATLTCWSLGMTMMLLGI